MVLRFRTVWIRPDIFLSSPMAPGRYSEKLLGTGVARTGKGWHEIGDHGIGFARDLVDTRLKGTGWIDT